MYQIRAYTLKFEGMKFISWFDHIREIIAKYQRFTQTLFLNTSILPCTIILVGLSSHVWNRSRLIIMFLYKRLLVFSYRSTFNTLIYWTHAKIQISEDVWEYLLARIMQIMLWVVKLFEGNIISRSSRFCNNTTI